MNTTHTVSLAVSAFLLLSSGCILEEPNFDDPIYRCESDLDCIVARHVCDRETRTCVLVGQESGPPPCDDQDGDGYGCNDDRRLCRFPEKDTDCVIPDIFPGAADLCDGKDNDTDGEVDEPEECTSIADCPRENLPEGAFFRCIDNTCVLKPSNTTPPGCDVALSCVDGAYEGVPETCK
jgi:hypothetical protein